MPVPLSLHAQACQRQQMAVPEVFQALSENDWWTTEAPEGLADEFRGVQDYHRPRVIEDCMKIMGCLSSVARDEPVAVHLSCCTHQYEFEFDRSLKAELLPKYLKTYSRTAPELGRIGASHRKPRSDSRSWARP